MTDLHIDDFYKDVAIILLRLYATFPRKTILYVEDICGTDQPDEFGLHSERFLSGFSAMIWLAEQGFIRFDAIIKQEALDQAVLTERSLLLLSSRSQLDYGDLFINTTNNSEIATEEKTNALSPSIMAQSKTTINQLRKAVKSGSSIMISQCVQYIFNRPA